MILTRNYVSVNDCMSYAIEFEIPRKGTKVRTKSQSENTGFTDGLQRKTLVYVVTFSIIIVVSFSVIIYSCNTKNVYLCNV